MTARDDSTDSSRSGGSFARRQRGYVALLVVLVSFFVWKPWRSNGPVTANASPERLEYVEHVLGGADPKQPLPLIIGLHGLGDTAESFAANLFAELDIEARLIVPSGPDWLFLGAGWFGDSSDHEALERSLRLVRGLAAHIRETRPTRGLPVVAGFSQGARLCYELAAEAPAEFAAVVPIAGSLVREFASSVYREPMPRILAIHGGADRIETPSRALKTATAFLDRCFDVELRMIPGVDHTVNLDVQLAFYDALREAVKHAVATATETETGGRER